jgi:integrase/recombinase XerD
MALLYFEAIQMYMDNCVSSGKTKDTLDGYGRTMRMFGDFLNERSISELNAIKPADLVSWKNERSSELSATSMRLYLSHLRLFFTFCVEVELIAKSPYSKTALKIDKSAIRAQSSKQYDKLLDEQQLIEILMNAHPKNMYKANYARNRAMLMLLLTSGMRNSSLRTLSVSDLDFKNSRIRLNDAKGGKSDYVLFPSVAQAVVREYLTGGSRPSDLPHNAPLFGRIDTDGTWIGYTRENLSGRVLSAVKGFCGVDGRRSHSLRHSMATILKKNGIDTAEISELLMHSDGDASAVTRRYITDDHRELFDKAGKVFAQICAG